MFPKGFVWGAATAAYQIEGAATADGKGLSIWDQFCREPGAVVSGDSGAVACNHYQLFREDVALLKEIGCQAYRLSLSWPRIIPEGRGAVNLKGLDFYDRLVDELLQQGITPYITLYHWDYPAALHRQGGWLNPDSPEWFARYTQIVVERLSDRVTNWFTFNENKIFILNGYLTGEHAPGVISSLADVLQIHHQVLLAHGKAVQAIRQSAKQKCQVGMASAVAPKLPATLSQADVEAARKANFVPYSPDPWVESIWSDPAYLGGYPKEMYQLMEAYLPEIHPDDLKIIAQPLDFHGLNIYFGERVRAGRDGQPEKLPLGPGHPRTAFNWPVLPETLYWGVKFFYERYHKPIYISENGLSNPDWVALDGKIHDPQRIDFTRRYLRELQKAIDDGAEVKGYFHWSLLDNFEWAEGYRQRFGLVYVDFSTGERIIKDSGYWYRQVIESNGGIL